MTEERLLHHYELTVRSGPSLPECQIDVQYIDQHDELIGEFGATTIAFATTWKEVAEVIRAGAQQLNCWNYWSSHVSPMVDLS